MGLMGHGRGDDISSLKQPPKMDLYHIRTNGNEARIYTIAGSMITTSELQTKLASMQLEIQQIQEILKQQIEITKILEKIKGDKYGK